MIILVLLLLALIGVPLFAIIALGAMYGFHQDETDLLVVSIEMFRLADMPILQAIPFFTFAGYMLGKSGAPGRLVRLSHALIGGIPGSLGIIALITSAFFTAFTGASGVTIIAIGALLYPALLQAGYDKNFTLGLVTTSGSLGLLFAPSLPLILYGVVAQQMSTTIPVRIEDLFIAGILPGLLMVAALAAWSVIRYQPEHSGEKVSIYQALKESAWELPLPIIVLGGIYSGFFAVTEAAAVTALYVLLVEVFILRDIKVRELPEIASDAMVLVGAIMLILAVSLASTNLMIDRDVPGMVFEHISKFVDSKWLFLFLLLLFLLFLGMLLDIFSALILVVPIILPVAEGFGVHPVHLGIMFLAVMQLGYITPPVGMNLFIASIRFERSVWEVYRATMPFFVILLIVALAISFIPEISLIFLP